MAFPGNVVRVVLSGILPGGESWSSAFYRAQIDAGTSMQSYADTLVAAPTFTAFVTALKPCMSPGTNINRVQTYRYTSGRAAVDYGSANVTGGTGTGTNAVPNQVCVVLTLRTAIANRTGRGRMYLPATGLLAGADGGFTTTPVTNLVNAAGPMLDGNQAVVLSETATTTNEVLRVDADRTPDTQRSRVNKVVTSRIVWTAP